jgi:hypothetical protein
MRIWIRNTAFSLQFCGFAICGLEHQVNLRICGLIITNLRICDCGMSPRIYGFAICRLKICHLTFDSCKKKFLAILFGLRLGKRISTENLFLRTL